MVEDVQVSGARKQQPDSRPTPAAVTRWPAHTCDSCPTSGQTMCCCLMQACLFLPALLPHVEMHGWAGPEAAPCRAAGLQAAAARTPCTPGGHVQQPLLRVAAAADSNDREFW